MIRPQVKPEIIRWARERAQRSVSDLQGKFPTLTDWEKGEKQPTLKQLEAFAKATRVPVGYLFLSEPPQETLPIPDLRTMADRGLERPSPDLLDTIYLCQQRQEWYRDFARKEREPKRVFVGSSSLQDNVQEIAARMRQELNMDLEERRRIPIWTDALRRFIQQADNLGVLVMVSGVVGVNNRRKLDPEEFRGFALADDLAPLIFINGADTKAAQMFTLAHELAHLWLGESALSDVSPRTTPDEAIEKWCNSVAAELLVPLETLQAKYQPGEMPGELNRLARRFKVSTLVVLRRLYDAGKLKKEAFWQAYEHELQRLQRLPGGGGGDFYLTQAVRAGKRFARALVVNTFEGHTSFSDAFRLLGIKKVETLRRFGNELGVRL